MRLREEARCKCYTQGQAAVSGSHSASESEADPLSRGLRASLCLVLFCNKRTLRAASRMECEGAAYSPRRMDTSTAGRKGGKNTNHS